MSEPDFDQIARQLIIATAIEVTVAAQLRQVWNARGAADFVLLEAKGHISEPYLEDVLRALRSLDR